MNISDFGLLAPVHLTINPWRVPQAPVCHQKPLPLIIMQEEMSMRLWTSSHFCR